MSRISRIAGKKRRFCSSVPTARMIGPASSLPIELTLSGIASAPISWFAIRCSRNVRPWPP
jgi:hypothetical protein